MRGGLVGDFYQVIKTIKGHRYLYKQRTFRRGGQVCTESHYLGPASSADVARVKAEAVIRKGGPSRAEVGAMFKLLCDPAQAASDWSEPWGGSPASTPWEDAPELDRLAAAARVGVLVLGPSHRDADPELVAAYDRRIDGVLMPPRSHFPSQAAYYATLMHELAHWTAHPSRLGRELGRRGLNASVAERQTYAREEVVAEATAMIVLAELGHRPAKLGPHALYLQTWLGRTSDPRQTLSYAMDAAHKAAGFILSGR